jgi:hypothetical protein
MGDYQIGSQKAVCLQSHSCIAYFIKTDASQSNILQVLHSAAEKLIQM